MKNLVGGHILAVSTPFLNSEQEITKRKKDIEACNTVSQYIPELNCDLTEFRQATSADISAYDIVILVVHLRETKTLQVWKGLREKPGVTVVLTSKAQEAMLTGIEFDLIGFKAFSVAIDNVDTFMPLRSYLSRR